MGIDGKRVSPMATRKGMMGKLCKDCKHFVWKGKWDGFGLVLGFIGKVSTKYPSFFVFDICAPYLSQITSRQIRLLIWLLRS